VVGWGLVWCRMNLFAEEVRHMGIWGWHNVGNVVGVLPVCSG